MDLSAYFEKHEDEFLKFERITNKLSNRPDIHAFLLLDKLVPGEGDMVSGSSHENIFLNTDVEKLLEIATAKDLIDLHRCGVMYDEDYESLHMFV